MRHSVPKYLKTWRSRLGAVGGLITSSAESEAKASVEVYFQTLGAILVWTLCRTDWMVLPVIRGEGLYCTASIAYVGADLVARGGWSRCGRVY